MISLLYVCHCEREVEFDDPGISAKRRAQSAKWHAEDLARHSRNQTGIDVEDINGYY